MLIESILNERVPGGFEEKQCFRKVNHKSEREDGLLLKDGLVGKNLVILSQRWEGKGWPHVLLDALDKN